MKNIIVVTGGAGFVGTNLIKKLILKTKFYIISIDNYTTGSKKNHIKNSRIKYLKGETENIAKILFDKKKRLKQFFILANFLEYIKVF